MSSKGENQSEKTYKYTSKEEKAINEYLKGKSKTEAYKSAYDTSRMKDKTANEYACRFFAKSKVKARIEQFQRETNTKAVLTRQELLEGLTKAFKMALGVEWQEMEEINLNANNEVLIHNKKKLKSADLKNIKGIAETLSKLQGWDKQQENNMSIPKIEIVGVKNEN